MAEFTGTGSHNSNYTGTLTVVETSYSIENNTSNVDWTLSVTSSNNWYFADWNVTSSVTINGVSCLSETAKKTLTKNGVTIIASGSLTGITHATDGSKTIACSASMQTATTQSYLFGTITMSGNLALTTIPRASTMTFGTLTIGSNATFTISRASNTFTHTIKYSFLGGAQTNITTNAGASYTWSPVPTSFYNSLPNATEGSIVLTLETYNSGTLIGTNVYNTKVYVGSGVVPSIGSITCSQVGTGWLNGKTFYVSGFSKVKVATTATAGAGTNTSITKYQISVDGQSGTGATWTSNTLATAGSKTVTVTVTDSRGRTATSSSSITVLQYTSPTATIAAERGTYSSGNWTANTSGAHIKATVTINISLTAQSNSVQSVTCLCGGSTPNATSGYTYYFTSTNTTSSYTITAVATDRLSTGATSSKTVPTIVVPIYWAADRLGFGKVGEGANRVDSAWNLLVEKTTANATVVRVKNPNRSASLQISASGVAGIYNDTDSQWIIYKNNNGIGMPETTGFGIGKAPVAGRIGCGLPLNTSFRDSIAMGSYGSAQSTVQGLVDEIRYSSGAMGSASITTAYTYGEVTIPTGWYNYIYSPHRDGGLSGAAQGDNCNYGTLFLMAMTSYQGMFRIRIESATIKEVNRICETPIQIFPSVANVGQTVGSATLAAVWSGMPNKSLLICNVTDFVSADRPTPYGTVQIYHQSASRGWIVCYGKGDTHHDWRMHLNSSNAPDGVWVRMDIYGSYSNTETDTGTTWVDGKAIYKKTLSYNNTAVANNTTLDHGIANINEVVKVEAHLNNDGTYMGYPTTVTGGAGDLGIRVSKTQIIFIGNDSWSANANRTTYVTIYYTKT